MQRRPDVYIELALNACAACPVISGIDEIAAQRSGELLKILEGVLAEIPEDKS